MGCKGPLLGERQGSSTSASEASIDDGVFTDSHGRNDAHIARLRRLAKKHATDKELASALEGAAGIIEAQGDQVDELKAKLLEIKAMLARHTRILEGLSPTEGNVLKVLQAFILDIMDAADVNDDEDMTEHNSADSGSNSIQATQRPQPENADDDEEGGRAPKRSKAERLGAEVMEILTQVYRLENQGKMAEAKKLRESLPTAKVLGESAINKASVDLENRIFRLGGLGTIMKAMDRVLRRPLIRQAQHCDSIHRHDA